MRILHHVGQAQRGLRRSVIAKPDQHRDALGRRGRFHSRLEVFKNAVTVFIKQDLFAGIISQCHHSRDKKKKTDERLYFHDSLEYIGTRKRASKRRSSMSLLNVG